MTFFIFSVILFSIMESEDDALQYKILSFNTQHCRNYVTGKIDFDLFAETIRSLDPDVVGLNEMRGKGVDPDYTAQTEALAEKLGYHFYFAKALDVGGCNPYGNALLSKHPILFAETIGVPDPVFKDPSRRYETRCLLRAKIDVPGGLTVCVTHFGLNPDEQLNAVQTAISSVEPSRCVLMGDFNLRPDAPLLEPIMERLYDTAELFSEPLLSFPSDKPRVKIDYIFTTKDIEVLSADIPAIVASDHRPYLATITLP